MGLTFRGPKGSTSSTGGLHLDQGVLLLEVLRTGLGQ